MSPRIEEHSVWDEEIVIVSGKKQPETPKPESWKMITPEEIAEAVAHYY